MGGSSLAQGSSLSIGAEDPCAAMTGKACKQRRAERRAHLQASSETSDEEQSAQRAPQSRLPKFVDGAWPECALERHGGPSPSTPAWERFDVQRRALLGSQPVDLWDAQPMKVPLPKPVRLPLGMDIERSPRV